MVDVGRFFTWRRALMAFYLLHSNRLGFGLMTRLEERWADIQGWPLPMVYFSVAAIVFCVCVAVDLPRRLAVWGTRGLWSPLLAWVDALWLRIFPER